VKQKLHLLCATNRVPLSYDELTSANVAEDVLLVGELLSETGLEGGGASPGGSLGISGLPRSGTLGEELSGRAVLLATEKADRRPPRRPPIRPPIRQSRWRCASRPSRCVFGMWIGGFGQDAYGLGHQDRGEGERLDLRPLGQPVVGQTARAHQGVVGLMSSQHSSRLGGG
jgi:hypothetical protein